MMNRTLFGAAAPILVMALLLMSVTFYSDGDGGFYEIRADDHPIVKTFDDVWSVTQGLPDSKKNMFWYEDEVFLAVARNSTAGNFTSYLYHSSDGGKSWDDPVKVMQKSDITLMRVEICIHGGSIFYLVFIIENYKETNDWPTRSLYCFVTNVTDWDGIGDRTPVRIDEDYKGYMPTYQVIGFGDDVYVFWIRSHYMDALYRVYSNGSWSDASFMDLDTSIGGFSAVTSNITGKERMYIAYQYHPADSIYLISSVDGSNWSLPSLLWKGSDSVERISMIEWNGHLHVVFSELTGYDIYHSSSSDGSVWSSPKRIAQNTLNDMAGKDPRTNSVVMAGNEDTGRLLVAFDTNSGVELLESKDNGTEFNTLARFKNDTAFYPNLCSKGIFLTYGNDESVLTIREIYGNLNETDDDNTTDPNDDTTDPPDDNTTDPSDDIDDNTTTPPDDNTTDPWNPNDDDTTDPPDDNSTDPNDEDPGEEDNGLPELWYRSTDSAMIVYDGRSLVEGGDQTFEASYLGYEGTELNFTWYIDGIGLVGHGPSITMDLPAGEYDLKVVLTDSQGSSLEKGMTIKIRSNDRDEGDVFWYPLVVILVIVALVLIGLGMFFMRRTMKNKNAAQAEIDMGIVSGGHTGRSNSSPSNGPGTLSLAPDVAFDREPGVRVGILDDGPSMAPLSPVPKDLADLREMVEDRGVRSRSDMDEIRRKARERYDNGEVPERTYKEIRDILDALSH